MKILSNQRYGEMVEYELLYEKTHKELNAMHVAFKRAMEKNGRETLEYANASDEKNKKIEELENKIQELEKNKHSMTASKGGTQRYINKLMKKINELELQLADTEKKLAESMTDKYIVHKLPKDRTRGKNKMYIRNCAIESKIAGKLHEAE